MANDDVPLPDDVIGAHAVKPAKEVPVEDYKAKYEAANAQLAEFETLRSQFDKLKKEDEARAKEEAAKADAKLSEDEKRAKELVEVRAALETASNALRAERVRVAIRDVCAKSGIEHVELVENLPSVLKAVKFDDEGQVRPDSLEKAISAVKDKYASALLKSPGGSPDSHTGISSPGPKNGVPRMVSPFGTLVQ